MSAPAQSSSLAINTGIRKLGIIAGGGDIPAKLLAACDKRNQDVFVIGFDGQTDMEITEGRECMVTRLGAAGQIIKTLRTHDIRDLIFIGSIRRPSLAELKPDMRTAQFFAKIGLKALGDDGLLTAMREELEKEGFTIHGVQQFMQELLSQSGAIGKHQPGKADWPDIERGMAAGLELGRLDIGQSVVVQEGIVLGVEGIEGTDALIRRCGHLKRAGRGPVLVKACKPQQDQDMDLPTVGPKTVLICADNGFSGIVVQAGKSLMLDADEMAEIADKNKMFIYAVEDEHFGN